MKVTKREFRIAAAPSLFGFFFCYFLAGQAMPPRSAPHMTIIYSTGTFSNTPAVTNQFPRQFRNLGVRMRGPAPAAASYSIEPRPELLGHRPRPNVDLFSSRYKVEVDLSDLQ